MFLRAKHPPRKSQVGEMHRKAEAIRIPASLPYQGREFVLRVPRRYFFRGSSAGFT